MFNPPGENGDNFAGKTRTPLMPEMINNCSLPAAPMVCSTMNGIRMMPSYREMNEHIELLPPLKAGSHRPQLLRNHSTNNSASTSDSTTQKEGSRNERTAVVRNGSVSRRVPVNGITVAHYRNKSRMRPVADSETPESGCSRSTNRYVPSPIDVANLSVYKNNDCIILPERKQEAPEPRQQCFYCNEWYCNTENTSGSCKEAPDPGECVIRALTCYPIAQAGVYHCCRSDDDDVPAKIGRFGQGYNVCSCGPRGTSLLRRLKRWLFVALLSLLVPCLCCYLPAHLLYKCCGGGKRGRHQPCQFASNSEH